MDINSIIHSDPDIMSGTPVFVGTRVPVKVFWDHLLPNEDLRAFAKNYPSVSPAQCRQLLAIALRLVVQHATTASRRPGRNDFIISAHHMLKQTIYNATKALRAAQGIRLADLRVWDLIQADAELLAPGFGVYVILEHGADGPTPLYVGRATSRSFVERVPANFDPDYRRCWFAHVVRKMVSCHEYGTLRDAFRHLADCRIVLVTFGAEDEAKTRARQLERVLIAWLDPRLNPCANAARIQKTIRDMGDADLATILQRTAR